MRYLSLAEVLMLHRLVLDQSGGATGLRDLGALESAVGQPRQSFGGADLYADLPSKAAAMGFSLIGHCIVKLASAISRFTTSSWRVVTPQLMGRADPLGRVLEHYDPK